MKKFVIINLIIIVIFALGTNIAFANDRSIYNKELYLNFIIFFLIEIFVGSFIVKKMIEKKFFKAVYKSLKTYFNTDLTFKKCNLKETIKGNKGDLCSIRKVTKFHFDIFPCKCSISNYYLEVVLPGNRDTYKYEKIENIIEYKYKINNSGINIDEIITEMKNLNQDKSVSFKLLDGYICIEKSIDLDLEKVKSSDIEDIILVIKKYYNYLIMKGVL